MTGAVGEVDFDESVFDDGAGAAEPVVGAAKPATAAEDDAKPANPLSQIAETAKKAGWAPKDEWKGDPADWLEAPEFILKAVGDVLPSMRKSLEKANEEISGLKKSVKASIQHLSKARQEGYEQRGRELQEKLDTASAIGDVAGVREITGSIVDLAKEIDAAPAAEAAQPEEPPELTAWKVENPWFGVDKALTAACVALGSEALADGYTGKAQVKEVDRRLREQFPGKFAKPTNPNRELPSAVEGSGSVRRPSGKAFSDMPKEHQDMWADMNKLYPMTKENYAREYFAQEK
jgi:hypothetical protein